MFRASLNAFMFGAVYNSLAPSEAFTLIQTPQLADGNVGFTANGPFYNYQSGFSLAKGDFNGDGYTDLAIGAPGGDCTVSGSVYIVFGPLGKEVDLRNSPSFLGEALGNAFGYSLTAGKFNNDPYDDLAIGSPFGGPGAAGRVHIIYGSPDFINGTFNVNNLNSNGTYGIVFTGELGNDNAGYAVKIRDGMLVIGAPNANPNGRAGAGSVYTVSLYNQSAPSPLVVALSTLNGTVGANNIWGTRIDGASPGDQFGSSVEIGDFNSDHFPDVVGGAPQASRFLTDIGGTATQTGAVSVIFGVNGSTSRIDLLSYLNGINGFSVYGQAPFAWTGFSVSMGKINASDTCSSLLIGAPKVNVGTQVEAGSSLLLYCNQSFGATLEASAIDGTNGVIFPGENNNDMTGKSVTFLPDMDGDGGQEIGIGTPGGSKTYVIFGNNLNKNMSPTLPLSTPNINGLLIDSVVAENNGISVIGVENITGTGANAVLVGASQASPYTNRASAGSSYVAYSDNVKLITNELNISAGSNHTFTTDNLDVFVPYNRAYTKYNITIALNGHFENKAQPGTNTTYFNQTDLENGNILFICDPYSKLAPSYTVIASHAWVKTPASRANVTFESNPLAIITNKLNAIRGGNTQVTLNMLNATNPDNPQYNSMIVVNIFNLSNGFFSPGDRFTLGDISNRRVSFTHDGSPYPPNYAVNFSFGGETVGPSYPLVTFIEPTPGPANQGTASTDNASNDSYALRTGLSVSGSFVATLFGLMIFFYKRSLDRKEFKRKRDIMLGETSSSEKQLNDAWGNVIKEILDGLNTIGCCGVNEEGIKEHVRALKTFMFKLQRAGVVLQHPLSAEQEGILEKTPPGEQAHKRQEFVTVNESYVKNVIVTETRNAVVRFREIQGTQCCSCCSCIPTCQPVLTANELDTLCNDYLVTAIKKRLKIQNAEEVEMETLETTEERKSTSEENTSAAQALSARVGELRETLETSQNSNADDGYNEDPHSGKVLSFRRTSSQDSSSEAPKPIVPVTVQRSS